MLDNFLIHLFHQGNCLEMYKVFGAHIQDNGVRFTVYAPNAKSVQVIGDFNYWNGQNHGMEKYTDGGIWTLFIPELKEYDAYKFRIETPYGNFIEKADPYAFFSESRPKTASKVFDMDGYNWKDAKWMGERTKNFDRNLNIYEAHIGSWKIKQNFTDHSDAVFYSYEEMIDQIIPYVKKHGYSHIELMPLTEYPFDGSWGYQPTGYFSATSRYGNPKQLMRFIDACHENGIGVIMDFVPAHFVKDSHGLMMFDGGCVYEYPNESDRYTEWDSCYFDFGREEVRSFLMSSVHFWAHYFHIDGIRFDAISNLIYWGGNSNRGTNSGAIEFMKRLNSHMGKLFPSLMLIAEDSTDYPNVTKRAEDGGLGFDYKWDLGWMNDTLKYFKEDPVFRSNLSTHHKLTFSMMYFYSERFILPFSHDEVVHGKGSLLNKMWGNHEQKFAQYKSLYLYMLTHPGKKLNFMGNEIAPFDEWYEKTSVQWDLLKFPIHDSFHRYVSELNQLIKNNKAFYALDYKQEGFEWLVVDDNNQSVFAFARKYEDEIFISVMNFIGNTHIGYLIPVPCHGIYEEVINSDQDIYNGSNYTNLGEITSLKKDILNKEYAIPVNIAPFGSMVFKLKKKIEVPKKQEDEKIIKK